MIDIRLIRTNPELVKENIKKKFQDEKLVLVDEVIELDAQLRTAATEADTLRNQRNVSSKQIGALMAQGKKEEAEEAKNGWLPAFRSENWRSCQARENPVCRVRSAKRSCWLSQTSLIDSVPIGRDDSENVEVERFGEPVVPDFEVPYHVDIMERLSGSGSG